MKKTLIIALVLIVGFSCCTILVPPLISAEPSGYWTDYAAEAFSAGDGTELDPYQISTPEELAYLATLENTNAYYELTTDLDMSAHYWTSIESFSGNLEGNLYSIIGLTNEPLIYRAQNDSWNGYVGNLILENVNLVSNLYVGGLASLANGFVFFNIRVSGNINNENTGYITGGIVGQAYSSTNIDSCINYANINARSHGGGIVGYSMGASIKNCVNYGSITAGGGSNDLGGICATASNGTIISYSINMGDIICTDYRYDYNRAGGICGYLSSGNIIVNYSVNSGDIMGQSAGSIFGAVGTGADGGSSVANCVHFPTCSKGLINGFDTGRIGGGANADRVTEACVLADETGVTIDDVLETLNAENPENPMWAVSNSVNEGVPHLTALYWEDV